MSIEAGERIYAADVDYPMAVVGTAGRGLIIYTLESQPKEYKRVEPPLKFQHRCISIFRDKKASPVGTGLSLARLLLIFFSCKVHLCNLLLCRQYLLQAFCPGACIIFLITALIY